MKTCDICNKLRNRNNIIKVAVNGNSFYVCNECSIKYCKYPCKEYFTNDININAVDSMRSYIYNMIYK